ncbi:MAG: DUF2157 domain-containing protein [Halothece sp.]
MVSEKFRRQLRKEAEKWQTEGLIDPSTFQQLAQRYQFHGLETDSQSRFVLILLALGGILLGLGIITLVAANWQGWSRPMRATLLITLFIVVNVAGFCGWQSQKEPWQRLGKALLVLGALMLGANLALMSQMFHQTGAVYELYLVWGGGVLAMAYGLQLTWLAMIAIILLGLGYWSGLPGFLNFSPRGELSWVLQYMPLLATLLFIPLAKLCQSRWVLFWGAIAAVSSFQVMITQELSGIFRYSPLLAGGMVASGIAIPPLLLWASDLPGFNWITRRLSIFFLVSVCYLFSYHYVWLDFSPRSNNHAEINVTVVLVQVFGGLALTGYRWWRLGQNENGPWRLQFSSTLVGMTSLIMGIVAGWSGFVNVSNYVFVPTLIYNLILFGSAIALIRQGLQQGTRLSFWSGLVLLTLQILSRMLEYQTGLVLKAVVLLLCGLAIVLAGLWFEGYLRRLS